MDTVDVEKLKKIIIVSVVILLLFASILIVTLVRLNKNNADENTELEYQQLQTIEDVVKYYKCKFISLEQSEDANYNLDVKLEFNKLLYEGETSNETFFNNIIKDIARVSNYQDFRLIDEKNEIKIEVICENYKIYRIIINGIEDYFIYTDSQMSLKQYTEIPITGFSIESQIIIDAINANWSKDINLGTRDSIYNQYNIYFDEGIKVRNINSKIHNIIFTNRYLGTVVNGITPGMSFTSIEQILGEPTFEDEDLELIGYKGERFYLFFTKNEISLYRLGKTEVDDFLKLTDRFLNEEIDFLEMMNELTYMWPDYSEYDYSADKVFISYPQKGVDIKINYDNTTAIILYNNFNTPIQRIKTCLEHTEFMGLLKLDNVFEAEKRRIAKENEEKQNLANYKKENIMPGYTSAVYDCYPILEENKYITKVKFIAKNGDRPNREINDTINNFLWANDVNFIFSKSNKGIYVYDLNVGIVKEILTGEGEYELKSFENGILTFDNSEIQLQF